MKIIVMGSGLIGVSSAYFLQKAGYDVVVIDKEKDVALETSFANGGQISVGYSEPWASVSNLKKSFSWIGKPDSPILFNPVELLKNPAWFLDFIIQCNPSLNKKNIKDMLELSLLSRNTMIELRDELNLQYEQKTNGIITYYTSQKSLDSSLEGTKYFQSLGCNRQIKSKDELIELEPSIKYSKVKIYGGDYLEEDESGNAFLFCNELKKAAEKIGVKFIFNHEVKSVKYHEHDKTISHIITEHNGESFEFYAELFVCALGSNSNIFLNNSPLKESIFLYPVKGYSATIDIKNPEYVNNISLTDSDKKIVFTKLGNKLRVAGTAEFNGYNKELNMVRCESLTNRAVDIFPFALDTNTVSYWTGLRPTTPNGMPYIKQSKIKNLYLNFGHGTLGFTMAAGSGKLISEIINNQK